MTVEASDAHDAGGGAIPHPLVVRVTHWVNVFAMGCMLMSGWAIYNASPLFGFTFPKWATLGGWLGGSIAWHFAAMWLLTVNGLIYVAYGVASGHFRRALLPIGPQAVARDFGAALRLKLAHSVGRYNAVQRLAYVVALALGAVIVLSGLALWKPVQFYELSLVMGGYEGARRVHFFAMAGLVGFILVHLALVVVAPRTLPAMVTGRLPRPRTEAPK